MALFNERQANDFALAIKGFIHDYIQLHKAAYLAYLLETGQKDEFYQTEVDYE